MNPYVLRYIKALKGKNDDLIGGTRAWYRPAYTVRKWVCKMEGAYLGTEYNAIGNASRVVIWRRKEGIVIYMDRLDCWDKLSGCPIILPAPKNDRDYAELIKWTRSIEFDPVWYDISNEYQTEKYVRRYPV